MRFCSRTPVPRMPRKPANGSQSSATASSEQRSKMDCDLWRARSEPGTAQALIGWCRLFLVAGWMLSLVGCAGYSLGPTNGLAAREKSVQVSPFVNQTLHPGLTDFVTSQMRKELQRDGTYFLATH